MNRFRTNKIIIETDTKAVDKMYDFYRIDSQDKYLYRAKLLDANADTSAIQSIKYDASADGRSVYVMTLPGKGTEIMAKADELNDASCRKVRASRVPEYVLWQLLLNGLNNYQSEMYRFNNLTGHLYVFNSDIKSVASAVEIRIDADGYLHLPVRTFVSRSHAGSLKYKKGKNFDSYTKYVKSPQGNSLIYKTGEGKSKDDYIMRSPKKRSVEYVDLIDEKFMKSKIGALYGVIRAFNRKYQGIAQIKGFEELEFLQLLPRKAREDDARLIELAQSRQITVQDTTGHPEYVSVLQEGLKQLYGIEARKVDEPVGCCIRVIKEPEDYKEAGEEDQHAVIFANASVQHIKTTQVKELRSINKDGKICFKEAVFRAVLFNLLVKEDIREGKVQAITYTDKGRWEFYYYDKNDSEDITCMTIDDGKLSFSQITVGTDEETNDLFRKLKSSPQTKCLMVHEGRTGLIVDTGKTVIPDYESIYAFHKEGRRTASKNHAAKEGYLASLLNINQVVGTNEYFVGAQGYNPNTNYANASHIYSIEGDMKVEEVLQFIDNTLVRNSQLAVMPLGVKYIREYRRLVARAQQGVVISNK